MFARRYLRRILVVIILLPVVALGLLVVYQNRTVLFQPSHNHPHPDHEHDHSKMGHNVLSELPAKENIRSRRSSSSSTPASMPVESKQSYRSSLLIPRTVPLGINNNNYNTFNRQPQQTYDVRQAPFPVIDTKQLARFVHLDLKGAAPKIDYFRQLFPFLKQLGATGLLVEYEDMFPFSGRLAPIRHGLAYSTNDVNELLKLAADNGLEVMPLLQLYGHLEYALKLKQFAHLREDSRYPQVITPCLEESYTLLFEMIDQMLALHPSISSMHIGCDEVYYRLIHPQCVSLNFRDEADLFIRHVTRIAKYIKSKRPNVKLFIWHDMLAQLANTNTNDISELIKLVVPMVWAYVDDVKPWFDEGFWMSFAKFPEVWVASSYKGSSGEITTMSYIGHHQRNQQTWLQTMHIAGQRQNVRFTGIAITGWSRYDHMLSLCELIPSSIPSLAYTLQTIVYGQIDSQQNETIARSVLGCSQMPLWERGSYTIFPSCTFPGHEMYEIMSQYDSILRQYEETIGFVRLYITDIHIRQNYIHYKRAQECMERLIYLEELMLRFIDAFQNISLLFFTPDIGPEWLQTYFMRTFKEVQQRLTFIERALRTQTTWLQRPLPNNTARLIVKRRNLTLNSYPRIL